MDVARLLLRLLVGGLFVGHGTQKLFGWFGGGGPRETGESFESLGLRPGRRQAVAAGVAETAGGALLAAGLATPVAAAALTGVQLTAIERVHRRKGPWNSDDGFEYNAVLIAAALVLAEDGPGRWSLDAALGRERKGLRWALAALAAGALCARAVLTVGGRRPGRSHDRRPRSQEVPVGAR